MGAHNIAITADGSRTPKQVQEYFDRLVDNDREQFGSDPYSGSWATFRSVSVITDKTFEDRKSASEYCLNHSEKWYNAVAVKFKGKDGNVRWLIEGWAAS